jgi:hypothetical protein
MFKLKSFKPTATKFIALQDFAVILQNGSIADINAALAVVKTKFTGKAWHANFDKLESVINTMLPEYTIFAKGNSKLPFYSFSTLPAVTCAGAGACLDFCYSFRAWRYPAAFMRQAQNALLMRFNKAAIVNELSAINGSFELRLYVDGDFSSVKDVKFWMNTLYALPDIKAYGYSKSFIELLQYDIINNSVWPTNYILNISSGHNSNAAIVDMVKALPITRGEFVAVSIGRKVKSNDHGTIEINKALREHSIGKIFPCPGTCGTCTGKGHACGMPTLKGITIAIAIH